MFEIQNQNSTFRLYLQYLTQEVILLYRDIAVLLFFKIGGKDGIFSKYILVLFQAFLV